MRVRCGISIVLLTSSYKTFSGYAHGFLFHNLLNDCEKIRLECAFTFHLFMASTGRERLIRSST